MALSPIQHILPISKYTRTHRCTRVSCQAAFTSPLKRLAISHATVRTRRATDQARKTSYWHYLVLIVSAPGAS